MGKASLVDEQRKNIALAALDPSKNATYVVMMALAYMRDYTNPTFAIMADAALVALKKEAEALEKDEQHKRRYGRRVPQRLRLLSKPEKKEKP